ncbi:MAG: glycosyltransferase [Sphingobacteriales bacterium]|jgi:glycosyltransferase involved in cell wall biosynthesis
MLFLSPVVPAAHGNGLAMRVGFFLQAYARLFDVDLAVFPIVATPAGAIAFAQRFAARTTIFPQPGIDAHFRLVAAIDEPGARIDAFRRFGRPSIAAFSAERARRALTDWAEAAAYDIVHVSRLYLGDLAAQWTAAARPPPRAMVLDCDEDDAKTYRRLAARDRGEGRQQAATWAEAEADAFARLAQGILPRFDLTFVASAKELSSLSAWTPRIEVVPNVPPQVTRRNRCPIRRQGKTILFVGTMGYAPNDDAARWMILRVLPQLRRACSAPVKLMVIGSHPGAMLRRLGRRRDVTITGTVRDLNAYYRRADLAVIPLRVGSGTRIKLLEAAISGVPVVSTGLGAEGTAFRHGRDLLIANGAQQFARHCAQLLRDSRYARSLAARADRRIAWGYDRAHWSRRIAERVAALAADRRAGG